MKIETRDVVVQQDVYISDDGREFTNVDECERHEIELLEESFTCYNSDFEKSDLESCAYVNLVTLDDVKKAKLVCEYFGIRDRGFDKPGIYMYNDYHSEWINLDDIMAHIRKEKENDQKCKN